jgi:hypothetical protein
VARAVVAGLLLAAVLPVNAAAQAPDDCRFICGLEWKFEPTFTIENLGNRHTVSSPEGLAERAERERVFELVLHGGGHHVAVQRRQRGGARVRVELSLAH